MLNKWVSIIGARIPKPLLLSLPVAICQAATQTAGWGEASWPYFILHHKENWVSTCMTQLGSEPVEFPSHEASPEEKVTRQDTKRQRTLTEKEETQREQDSPDITAGPQEKPSDDGITECRSFKGSQSKGFKVEHPALPPSWEWVHAPVSLVHCGWGVSLSMARRCPVFLLMQDSLLRTRVDNAAPKAYKQVRWASCPHPIQQTDQSWNTEVREGLGRVLVLPGCAESENKLREWHRASAPAELLCMWFQVTVTPTGATLTHGVQCSSHLVTRCTWY